MTARHRLPAAALGLLVGWQFLYLPLANLPAVVPAAAVPDTWGEFTGHYQAWPLFAGDAIPAADFLTVEATLPGGEVVSLPSPFEPADPGRSVRIPGASNRLFNEEIVLGLAPAFLSPEVIARSPDECRQISVAKVTENRAVLPAFARMRWEAYRAEHPSAATPVCYQVVARIYTATRTDGSTQYTLTTRPVARWTDGGSIEAYEPVDGRFVPVGEPTP